jgi:hypothetical protein
MPLAIETRGLLHADERSPTCMIRLYGICSYCAVAIGCQVRVPTASRRQKPCLHDLSVWTSITITFDFSSHGTIGEGKAKEEVSQSCDVYDVTMLKTVPVVSQDFVLMSQPLILPAIQPVSLHSQH